ncbi:MAG: DUF2851 family protein [Kiritimatiellae bacterium]|nr:DUF2851 family protein [Kiritimatiellia bacterium]
MVTTSIHERLRSAFPEAGIGSAVEVRSGMVRESGVRLSRPFSERHLHCVWYDAKLRPPGLTTLDGEPVVVEDPGAWNLEAGPDFLGAVIRIGKEERRFSGDVEIHIRGSDWNAHGHQNDPRYRGVKFHVTYHAGPSIADHLPPGTLEIPLQPALQRCPEFDFHAIELTAYPYGERAVHPPCRAILETWDADRKMELLKKAGQSRLLQKAEMLHERIEQVGDEQAFYEQFMIGLGYRDNKAAYRQLARLLPLSRLRELSQGDWNHAYALLAGAGGLLPDPDALTDPEAKVYVRACWDHFWRDRDRLAGEPLTRSDWKLSGLRPMNFPARRLMAAAQKFSTDEVFRDLDTLNGLRIDQALSAWMRMMGPWEDSFWSRRVSWDGKWRPGNAATLIGTDRLQILFTNLVVPWMAVHRTPPEALIGLDSLPAEGTTSVLKQAAFYLFGPDMPSIYLKSGLRQQGLLHLFHEFCLRDRTRCVSCLFPGLLGQADSP